MAQPCARLRTTGRSSDRSRPPERRRRAPGTGVDRLGLSGSAGAKHGRLGSMRVRRRASPAPTVTSSRRRCSVANSASPRSRTSGMASRTPSISRWAAACSERRTRRPAPSGTRCGRFEAGSARVASATPWTTRASRSAIPRRRSARDGITPPFDVRREPALTRQKRRVRLRGALAKCRVRASTRTPVAPNATPGPSQDLHPVLGRDPVSGSSGSPAERSGLSCPSEKRQPLHNIIQSAVGVILAH